MTTTPNRGFAQAESTAPDYQSGGAWARIDAAIAAIDAVLGRQVCAANGAINIKEGIVFITKTTAAALTLATPVVGSPASGGDDGKVLKIIALTAHAHTVTTAADVISGADDTITYAAVGDYAELIAYDGVWYAIVGGPTPASLSEV